MHAWRELKECVEELRLTRVQRTIAQHLIEGTHTREMAAAAVGVPQIQVKLCAAYLLYLLRKYPPDASIAVNPFVSPPRRPGNAGVALKLPQ